MRNSFMQQTRWGEVVNTTRSASVKSERINCDLSLDAVQCQIRGFCKARQGQDVIQPLTMDYDSSLIEEYAVRGIFGWFSAVAYALPGNQCRLLLVSRKIALGKCWSRPFWRLVAVSCSLRLFLSGARMRIFEGSVSTLICATEEIIFKFVGNQIVECWSLRAEGVSCHTRTVFTSSLD
jgi:hypothetical protein